MENKSFKPVKFYKRRWIVNYQVQFILIGYSLFLIFAVVGSQYLFQLLAFQKESGDLDTLQNVRVIIYTAVTILFLIVLFYGFNLTNRIVGPIYRLKEHIDSVNQGKEMAPFNVRKNDYFREIVEPYNELIKKIRK